MGSTLLRVSMCACRYWTSGSDLLRGWKAPARCLKASEDAVLIKYITHDHGSIVENFAHLCLVKVCWFDKHMCVVKISVTEYIT